MKQSFYLIISLTLLLTPAFSVMAQNDQPAATTVPASEPGVTAEPASGKFAAPPDPATQPGVTPEPTVTNSLASPEPTGGQSTVTGEPVAKPTVTPKPINKEPVVNAAAAILMDAATGKIIYQKNSQALMAPASTTKIMTAILALEKLSLDQRVWVSQRGVSQEGTSVGLRAREGKTVRELLYGLMLVSGNDAAKILAKAISGSEKRFALLMTKKAKLLGMKNTKFKNASGLPATGLRTTAYDMAILTRYALKNGHFAVIVKTKFKNISGAKPGTVRRLRNHNKLLWKYPYATGVKTGYTISAGGCLVSSATHNGKTLIAVVLKTRKIYDDSIKMFNYGFGR